MTLTDKLKRAVDLQGELDSIIQEIKPKLVKIAKKKHSRLGETIENVHFHDDDISFMAGGYAMGYFEDGFQISWDELNKIS